MIPFYSYIILGKRKLIVAVALVWTQIFECRRVSQHLASYLGDRRTTLQKRKVSPGDSMMTVCEYVHFFYWLKEEFCDDLNFEALFTDANTKYKI